LSEERQQLVFNSSGECSSDIFGKSISRGAWENRRRKAREERGGERAGKTISRTVKGEPRNALGTGRNFRGKRGGKRAKPGKIKSETLW